MRVCLSVLLALPLALTACSGGPDEREVADGGAPANVVRKPAMPASPPPAPAPSAPTPSAPPPAAAPLSEVEMKGKEGAQAVLTQWAQALEHRDWNTARALWGDGGKSSGLDPAAFAIAYEKYATIAVTIGDGSVEGGAGSLYYEVPATMTGKLRDGRPYRLEGLVVVRRVNDVDGATAAQLAWHMAQSDLKPKP